ncbi:MAG: PAS domain-containing sensor histidine kinase [Raineya sp.]|nr:PAS domain-containing sensor histidine kinase [Raineya sp.]MDW8295575.1 PAS domain-containing sensor histidine kinase [Raineya sp.]
MVISAERMLEMLGNTCACLVTNEKGYILQTNDLAQQIFQFPTKTQCNFIENYLNDVFIDNLSSSVWAGDLSYKVSKKPFFTQIFPDSEAKKWIWAIYPQISETASHITPKLQKVLQEISEGILFLDVENGNILQANNAALKYLHYNDLSELRTKKFSDIEKDLAQQKSINAWKRFLIEVKQRSPEPYEMISLFLQKEGTTIPVQAEIFYDENDGDAYVSVVFRDISSQDKFVEELLDSQSKKFQLLIENLEDSVLLLDEAATIQYASPAAHKSWGFQSNELHGENFFDLVHPYDSSLAQKIFFEVINTRRKLFRTTFRILYKDGSAHWMEIKAKNLLREPSINAVLVIIHNVTQQTLAEEKIIQALENEKRLNEELAKREERLKNTLELVRQKENELKKANQVLEDAQTFAKMGSWYINIKTDEIFWSRQTFISFGMNPDTDKVPKDREQLKNYIHPDDRNILSEYFDKIIAGEIDNYELELRQYQKKEDSYKWFLTKAQAIKENGELIGISGITLDIHERKIAEEKIRQANEELSKANSELDRFVYSVSHDLRAPISSLLGLIQLARMTDNLPQIKEYLSLQEKSIRRLDNFIKDILDYSRNARLEIQPEVIHFQELIENCFEQYNYMENSKKILKTIEVKGKVPFYSDKSRLNIVFNNLLSNAIKYANMRQEQPFIEVKVDITRKQAKVSIRDNGIGIHKDHIGKVFNMFYRANDMLAGSGLGLYIVKEAINKLRGEIALESELGKGTKVYFTIPNLGKG